MAFQSGWPQTVLHELRHDLHRQFPALRAGSQPAHAHPVPHSAGAGGGGLQPTEQAILADTFSAEKRAMGFAMYGVAILVAPAIGPTLGGWITDNTAGTGYS